MDTQQIIDYENGELDEGDEMDAPVNVYARHEHRSA